MRRNSETTSVKDLYDLEDFLYTKSQEKDDSYWESSYSFFQGVKNQSAKSLTEKQEDWLEKLEASMEEEG